MHAYIQGIFVYEDSLFWDLDFQIPLVWVVYNINSPDFIFQIFYDLVRQINSKTPEKPEKKKKSRCLLL